MTDKELVAEQGKFMIRLPAGLREMLAVRAKARGVSMNTLAVEALREFLEPTNATYQEMLRELQTLDASLNVHETAVESLQRDRDFLVQQLEAFLDEHHRPGGEPT